MGKIKSAAKLAKGVAKGSRTVTGGTREVTRNVKSSSGGYQYKKQVATASRNGKRSTTKLTGVSGQGKVTGIRKLKSVAKVKKTGRVNSKVKVTQRTLKPSISSSRRSIQMPRVNRTGGMDRTITKTKQPISVSNAAKGVVVADVATASAHSSKNSTTYKRRTASGKTITVNRTKHNKKRAA